MAEQIAKVSPSGRPTGDPADVVRVPGADEPTSTAVVGSGSVSDDDKKKALAPALAGAQPEGLQESKAPQKTVILDNVTVHKPLAGHVPIKWDGHGGHLEGKRVVGEFPPGTAVTLDEDDANRLLAQFGGREVPPEQAAKESDIKRV